MDNIKSIDLLLKCLLQEANLTKCKTHWKLHINDGNVIIIPQKSAYSNQYYLNIKITFDSLLQQPLERAGFDVMARAEMIVPETEHKKLADALNFEITMSDEQRVGVAQLLMGTYIYPWIVHMSNFEFVLNDARQTQSNLSQRNYLLGARFRGLVGES